MSSTEWTRFFREAGIPNKVAVLYAKIFVDNRIVMSMLPDITREVLRDIGITAIGDIIAVLNYAKTKLREEAEQNELLSISGMAMMPGRSGGIPGASVMIGGGDVGGADDPDADLYYQGDVEDEEDGTGGTPAVKGMRLTTSRVGYDALGAQRAYYSFGGASGGHADDSFAHSASGYPDGDESHVQQHSNSMYDYPSFRFTTAPGRNRYARAPLPQYKSYGKVKFMESQIGHHPLAICRSDVPGHSYEYSYQKKSATKKIFRCSGCLVARKRCEFGGKVKVLQVIGDDIVNGNPYEDHHPDCMPVSNARIMVRKVRRFINSEVRDGRMDPEDAFHERHNLIDQFLAAESDQEDLPSREECEEYWPKKSALLVQLNTVKTVAMRRQFEAENPVFPQEPDPDPEPEGAGVYGDEEMGEDGENIDQMIERTERELQEEIKREAEVAAQQLYYEYEEDIDDPYVAAQRQAQATGGVQRLVVTSAGSLHDSPRRKSQRDRRIRDFGHDYV